MADFNSIASSRKASGIARGSKKPKQAKTARPSARRSTSQATMARGSGITSPGGLDNSGKKAFQRASAGPNLPV